MRATKLLFTAMMLMAFVFSGCKKETEEFQTDKVADYFQLSPGKYITYRTDSTVFLLQGRREETHSYQEKHLVDALVTDNLGRPSYRIFRYLRDTLGSQPWAPTGSYFITPLTNTVEIIENNLRGIRFTAPVKTDRNWKGFTHLSNDPYATLFGSEFNNDDNMYDWDFTYEGTGETVTIMGQTYSDVITLKQIDEAANAPVTDPNSYGFINYSEEKYARGIGLVYQNFIMWEYQVIPGITPYKLGFGVKRRIIDHN